MTELGNPKDLREALEFLNPEALLITGLDKALIGISHPSFMLDRALAVYSSQKIIEIIMKEDDVSEEEALEYFYFNIIGAYVGENTPIFIDQQPI
tara:strand:- start:344 stop:628 length:285 start_codon:yes stop_codon:yes gene_type:complete